MNAFSALALATSLSLSVGASMPLFAQDKTAPATSSAGDGVRVSTEIRKELAGLANYGVFDWITYVDHGKTVVLKGFASRPSLKTDAERAVKAIPSVEGVENQIEVLPLSPNDDRIRDAVYNRIYTQPSLRKYNANAGSLGSALGPGRTSVALISGSVTNSPPIGYHAIHIIVQNGNVILYGVVLNAMDASIDGIQANLAPGVFGVDNDLIVQRSGAR